MKAEEDRTIQLIQLSGALRSLDWSPDGTRIAIGDAQRSVSVWTAEGRRLWQSAVNCRRVNSVAWSPDGNRIAAAASGSLQYSMIHIFDALDGTELLATQESKTLYSVAWSPDGTRIVSDSQMGSRFEVRISDSATGQRERGIEGDGQCFIYDVVSSRKGDVAWRSNYSGVHVWDAKDGSTRILGDMSAACLRWSPDGRFLATGRFSGEIQIWDVVSGNCIREFSKQTSLVYSISWSPSGRVLAAAFQDGLVQVWSVDSGEELIQFDRQSSPSSSIAFAPTGAILASANLDGSCLLWDVADIAPPGEIANGNALENGESATEYIVRQAASIGRRPRVIRTEAVKETPLWVPDHLPKQNENELGFLSLDSKSDRESKAPTCACVVPGALKELVTNSEIGKTNSNPIPTSPRLFCGLEGAVVCTDLTTGERVWNSGRNQRGFVRSIDASLDGRFVATCGGSRADDEPVAVWDAETGRLIFEREAHSAVVNCVRWSPDGQSLATGSEDWSIKILDARTGETQDVFRPDARVWCIEWSPNGRWLAAGSTDNKIRIWDLNTRSVHLFLQGHENSVSGLAWSPNGRWLASGGDDKAIIIWDLDSGTERFRCVGHPYFMRSMDWSSDGRWIATAGLYESSVRVWDALTGEERTRFVTNNEAGWWDVNWSSDGAFLAAAEYGSKAVRFWDTRELALEARQDAATSKEKESYSPVYGLPPKSAGGLRFNQSSATNDQSGDSGDVPSGPPLSSREARLIRGLGTMRSLHIHPPLSVIDDLVELLGGLDDQVGSAFGCLSVVEGMRKLVSLRWPRDARLGLAAFLLHEVPFTEEWTPPEDWSVDELSDTLFSALNGAEQVDPEVPFASLIHIKKSLDQVDDRLLTFLKILGPETVAKNPSILVMQRHRLPMIPATVTANHRWIGQHVSLHESGRSSGVSGGGTSSGIETRGRIQHVLPWQWLLDSDEFDYRYAQSDLLYRSFEGADPPKLRPTVILLDVSPPVFGPVEMITRPAADSVARTLLRHQLPVVLITTGVRQTGHEGYFELKSASDLLHIWTESTLEPANYGRALQLAQSAQRWLSTGSEPASILVFSHPWFGGSSRSNFPELSHLRGLFVQYPKHPHVQPSIHDLCEKWECLSPNLPDRLANLLGRLVG